MSIDIYSKIEYNVRGLQNRNMKGDIKMKKLSNNERKKGDKTKMEYKRDF